MASSSSPPKVIVKWKTEDEEELLRLIKTRTEWICLFAEGQQQLSQKWIYHRDIAIALWPHDQARERRFLWILQAKLRGLVVVKDGKWEPTDLWDHRVSNPIRNKISQ
ncbi:hypothetical protein BD324DRAFT_312092 [Kockovaella imperatae]|uniref:Uncharacterized protein n=1 Tax=Kockovaella imperatae TaxID=4999 RepID=A0A1Y1UNT2_9TREE|nr:hypothetical protein BD324DRAFT_312092 [Kockovaella imperatae]ORX39126.1 hypothetical protein BD324DRAFT_312092 [Kockovaella imperatae]